MPLLAAALAVVVSAIVLTRAGNRPLDPDEPIAADGSMIAGRARTIYDTHPLLGGSGWTLQDSDDPANFGPRLDDERRMNEHDRMAMAAVIGPLDWSRCEDLPRRLLISATQAYYGERGRQIRSFSLRGPRAKAAVEAEWSKPLDREIDDFIRHAVQYGILHKSEMPANLYPEFARLFGDTRELGAGCPPLRTAKP
jgi:hypothetical protein